MLTKLVVVGTLLSAFGLAGEANELETSTFTKIPFSNAPEALLKVIRSKRLTKDAVLLTVLGNACAPMPGSISQERVVNARNVTFSPGEILLVGPIGTPSSFVMSVRKVEPRELKAKFLGCPRSTR